MTFHELKGIAGTRIYRLDSTKALYESEDRAKAAIKDAARELEQVLAPPHAERTLTSEEVLALELASLLEAFGRSGSIAARIIVDRYGMQQE